LYPLEEAYHKDLGGVIVVVEWQGLGRSGGTQYTHTWDGVYGEYPYHNLNVYDDIRKNWK
jgi:hypothetical protein